MGSQVGGWTAPGARGMRAACSADALPPRRTRELGDRELGLALSQLACESLQQRLVAVARRGQRARERGGRARVQLVGPPPDRAARVHHEAPRRAAAARERPRGRSDVRGGEVVEAWRCGRGQRRPQGLDGRERRERAGGARIAAVAAVDTQRGHATRRRQQAAAAAAAEQLRGSARAPRRDRRGRVARRRCSSGLRRRGVLLVRQRRERARDVGHLPGVQLAEPPPAVGRERRRERRKRRRRRHAQPAERRDAARELVRAEPRCGGRGAGGEHLERAPDARATVGGRRAQIRQPHERRGDVLVPGGARGVLCVSRGRRAPREGGVRSAGGAAWQLLGRRRCGAAPT
jgi:hypothetical protein